MATTPHQSRGHGTRHAALPMEDAMLNFLWDLHQQGRINELAKDANAGRGEAARRIELLETRLDALVLTSMAMWSMLEERLGVTEEELAERVREIDLRDGRLDGKVAATGGTVTCAACGRVMSARHRRCIYCGGERAAGVGFGEG